MIRVMNIGSWLVQFGVLDKWSMEVVDVEFEADPEHWMRVIYMGPFFISFEGSE